MRIVLIDHLALRRQSLELFKHRIRTIRHALDLIPLGGIRDRHPHHGLIPLQPVEGHPQVVAPQHQHRPCPGAVFLCPRLGRHGRREHLATGRTAELLQLIAHRRQERVAIQPHLHPGRDPIQAPPPTHGTALACRQGLMVADHVLRRHGSSRRPDGHGQGGASWPPERARSVRLRLRPLALVTPIAVAGRCGWRS